MTKNLRRDEKAKLIEQSLKGVQIRHEKTKNPPVKVSHLNHAAAKVAAEYADFETPWEQSLNLMVEAAGVQLAKLEGSGESIEELTPSIVASCIRQKNGSGRKFATSKIKIEHGFDGYDCYKLLSRSRFLKTVGFTFLRRKHPTTSHLSSPYALTSVADVHQHSEFWLFSSHGVLYSNNEESEFLSLSDWGDEYEKYRKAKSIPYIKLFRLRKYFTTWRAIGQKLIFEKRRKVISRNLLLTEIELAQPTFAVSSLLVELETMNILPQLSNVWSLEPFKKASTLCHLDLANMVENLFMLSAVIFSGTHSRIKNNLQTARNNVTSLDRAPRSNSESWHQLRQNLAVAQKVLVRFERAEFNFTKFQNQNIYRIRNALLKLRRKQLIYVWNRLNSEPVLVVSLSSEGNKIVQCPTKDQWVEAITIFISDIVPIIGLARERAQNAAETEDEKDSEGQIVALKQFDRVIPFVESDEQCDDLLSQIKAKMTTDLESVENFIANELKEHDELNKFLDSFDLEKFVDEVFLPDGHITLQTTISNFVCWQRHVTGNLHIFGCASMSTSYFSTECLSKVKSIREMILRATSYRLREEIEKHNQLAEELDVELRNAQNCEKLAVFANNIGAVRGSYDKAAVYIRQLSAIVDALSELPDEFCATMKTLQSRFDAIGQEVEKAFYFLQNPNERTIQELEDKFFALEKESKTLEAELFTQISQGPWLLTKGRDAITDDLRQFSAENLEFFYRRFHRISKMNESSSNIIAGLMALNRSPPFLPCTSQVFEWYRHCHRLWTLAQSTDEKIRYLKDLRLGEEKKLQNSEIQLRQTIDEIEESVQALYEDHKNKILLKEQVKPYIDVLSYWLQISSEVILLLSAELREKEWKKFDKIIAANFDLRSEITLASCQPIAKNFDVCRQMRRHRAKMAGYESQVAKARQFWSSEFVPLRLRPALDDNDAEDFYFDDEIHNLNQNVTQFERALRKLKSELTMFEHLADDDDDKKIVIELHQTAEFTQSLKNILNKTSLINRADLIIRRHKVDDCDEFQIGRKELFRKFEEKRLDQLADFASDIENLEIPNFDTVLTAKIFNYPNLKYVPNEQMLWHLSTGLSVKVVQSLCKVLLPSVAQLEHRQLSARDVEKVFNIQFEDGGWLPIDSLFVHPNQNFDQLFVKLEEEIKKSSRKCYEKYLGQILSDPQKIYSSEFWKLVNAPAVVAIVIFEVAFGVLGKLDKCKIKDLQKALRGEGLHLQSLACGIDWALKGGEHLLFRSAFQPPSPADSDSLKFILKNIEQFTSATVCVLDYSFNWWPSSVGPAFYLQGMFRQTLLTREFECYQKLGRCSFYTAKCLATLLGRNLFVLDKSVECPLAQGNALVYFSRALTNREEKYLVQLFLDDLGERTNIPPRKSDSAMDVPEAMPEECATRESSSNVDLKVSKGEFVQYLMRSVDNVKDVYLKEFEFNLEETINPSVDVLRTLLTNMNLIGHSKLAEKIFEILSEFCDEGSNTWSTQDLDTICALAVKVNSELEKETELISTESSNESVESTSNSLTSSTSSSSKSAQRSQSYSTMIRKSKNVDISVALALYLFVTNFDKVFRPEGERFLAHSISSHFPVIRTAFFDRLWQNISSVTIPAVAQLFLRAESFNGAEIKQLSFFVNSILLASFRRQEIRIRDTIISELFIQMISHGISLQNGITDSVTAIVPSGSDTNLSTSTNSLSSKVSKIGAFLLPDIELIHSDNVRQTLRDLEIEPCINSSRTTFWIITRYECANLENIPENVRIFFILDMTSGLPVPDFLWETFYTYGMLHFDVELCILKEQGERVQRSSMSLLSTCFNRVGDVYQNTPIGDEEEDAIYSRANICHWLGLNSVMRLLVVQKHLFLWAHAQGILPSDMHAEQLQSCEETLAKVDRLIRFSVFWSFAMELHPRAREAFSTEFQQNLSGFDEDCDLSQVYISTSGDFERFIDLSEYQNNHSGHNYVPSVQLLQGKWLLGIFAPTNQSVVRSSFQIIGPKESGKSHLVSYYDLDHPKPQSVKLIPGSSRAFFERYQKFSHSQLVPDDLTTEMAKNFITCLRKPILSIGAETFSYGYPFLNYFVDFSSDIEMIYCCLIQNKLTMLVNRCMSNSSVAVQMAIDALSQALFSFFKDLALSTKSIKMGNLTWLKLISVAFFDLANFYLERDEAKKANWFELLKFIVEESILQITRILYSSCDYRAHARLNIDLLQSLFPALAEVRNTLADFDNLYVTRRMGTVVHQNQSAIVITALRKSQATREKRQTTLFAGTEQERIRVGDPLELFPRNHSLVVTSHFVQFVEQALFCFRVTNKVVLESTLPLIGRRMGAQVIAKLLNIQLFEINGGESFTDQMLLALRMDKPLMFFIKEESVPEEHWDRLLTLARTGDVFSILTFGQVCRIIDPKNYHATKYKIRCTALEQVQQKWFHKMHFLIAPRAKKSLQIESSIVLSLSPWRTADWALFVKNCLSDTSPEIAENFSIILSTFIRDNELHFSPDLVRKCLKEYLHLEKLRMKETNEKFGLMKKVCDSINNAHEGYQRMIGVCDESKEELERAISTLEELKCEADICLSAYRAQFDATLESERAFKKLEVFVNELRLQTDTNSQFHPLFERAQSVLQTLDAHDFEEIRTYRKPPMSVVLVVEAICILFNQPPTWEAGQLLLHRENFFQELEFFDKESVSASAFQKLQHRLNRVDEREVKKASTAALGLLHWLEAIAGFSTTYSKMLPIIRQLESAESDLSAIQMELGRARVSLDDLKSKFDEVDARRIEQTETVAQLQSKIRHQKAELEALPIFLENLEFCSDRWRESLSNLEYQRYALQVEMLVAMVYLFLLSRYGKERRESLLNHCHKIATRIYTKLTPVINKCQHFANLLRTETDDNVGQPEPCDILETYLSQREIAFSVLDWAADPDSYPALLMLNKVQDMSQIRNEFYRIVCGKQFSDFVKRENMNKWNEQIITKEIKDLEDRLFGDLIDQKVPLIDLRNLRKIVDRRKNAKSDWKSNLDDNQSLAQEQLHRRAKFAILVDAAIDCLEVFVSLEGRLYPSRYMVVKSAIGQLPQIKIVDDDVTTTSPLLSIFFARLLADLSRRLSPALAFKFKSKLAIKILTARNLLSNPEGLYLFLANQSSNESLTDLTDELEAMDISQELEEWCSGSDFTPFLPFWKNPKLTPETMISIFCRIFPEEGKSRMLNILCMTAFGISHQISASQDGAYVSKVILTKKNGERVAVGKIVADLLGKEPFLSFERGFDQRQKAANSIKIILGGKVKPEINGESVLIVEEEECLKGDDLNNCLTSEKWLRPSARNTVEVDKGSKVTQDSLFNAWVADDLMQSLTRKINSHVGYGLVRLMSDSSTNADEKQRLRESIRDASVPLRVTLNRTGEKVLKLYFRYYEKQNKAPVAFLAVEEREMDDEQEMDMTTGPVLLLFHESKWFLLRNSPRASIPENAKMLEKKDNYKVYFNI